MAEPTTKRMDSTSTIQKTEILLPLPAFGFAGGGAVSGARTDSVWFAAWPPVGLTPACTEGSQSIASTTIKHLTVIAPTPILPLLFTFASASGYPTADIVAPIRMDCTFVWRTALARQQAFSL
jgi:hypothetical protein